MISRLEQTAPWEFSAYQKRYDYGADFFAGTVLGPPYIRYRTFLDVGCGKGAASEPIKVVLGLDHVDGIDLVADRLEEPGWLVARKVDLECDAFPYPDNYFDGMICGEVIEHVYNSDNLLKEVRRTLRPGGVCLITTPNLGAWVQRLLLLFGYQPYSIPASFVDEKVGTCRLAQNWGQRGHIRGFTLKALLDLLNLYDFKVVKIRGWDHGLVDHHTGSFLSKIVAPVDTLLSKRPSLATRLAVAVTKEAVLEA